MKSAGIERALSAANRYIELACRMDGRNRTGGMLCVAEQDGIVLTCLIGEISEPAKILQYTFACQEGAKRLLEYLEHVSSWQSRDFDSKKYGGAIRSDNLVISFAGLSEHLNEAFSSIVAWQMLPGMSLVRWTEIQTVSRNIYMNKFGLISS